MNGPERFLRSAELARHLKLNHRAPEDSMTYDAIQGILNFEQLEAWIKTEREIGPRTIVMEWLHEKNQELLEADFIFDPEDPQPEADRERSIPPKECYHINSDGERVPWSQRPTSPPTTSAFERITAENESEVATDGGEKQ